MENKGTITWIEIANGKLPLSTGRYSDKYLLLLPNRHITQGEYVYEENAFIYSGGWCSPTHWAFINYPN